jgi:hypothetical protein
LCGHLEVAQEELEQQQQGIRELPERTRLAVEALQTSQQPEEEGLAGYAVQLLERLVEVAQHRLPLVVELVDQMFPFHSRVELQDRYRLLETAGLEAMET